MRGERQALGREFAKLWTSNTVSNLGDGIRFVAFPLLAGSLTDDPARVSGVFVALTVPALVFGLQAGALLDRLDRRRVLGLVNLAQAGVIAALAAAVAADVASLGLLYVVAFIVGSAETFVDNAATTLVPDVVPRDRLEAANGRLDAAHTAANDFAGSVVGAMLFAAAAPIAFVSDAALTVVAALVALRLRGTYQSPRGPKRSLRADVAVGLRFAAQQPTVRALFSLIVVVAAVDMAWFGILVLFAREELGLDEIGFGVLLAVGAAGTIAGGLLTDRVRRTLGPAATMSAGLALQSLSLIGLLVARTPLVAYAALATNGAGFAAFNVMSLSLRQRLTPTELLGRVNGTFRFLAFGATAVGAAAGGVLARAAGLRAPFWVGAPVLALCAAVAAAVLRHTPRDDAGAPITLADAAASSPDTPRRP